MRMLPPGTLLLLAACGAGAEPISLATRADSAGIAIVTNPGPSLRVDSDWQIDPIPVVSIGSRQDGDPRYDLLRVGSGTILPGGEIVVLASGNQEIRFFSASGEWIRTIGRAGDGPGEMRRGAGLFRSGDTLHILDGQLGRLSAFGLEGSFLTSWPYPTSATGGRLQLNQRFDDGSWAANASLIFSSEAGPTSGTSRMASAFLRIAADLSGSTDTIAATPGTEQHLGVTTGSGGAIQAIRVFQPPFGRSTPNAVAGNRFIWGDNGAPEIRLHQPDGTLLSIVRWEAPRIPITPELIASVRDAALARQEGNEPAQQRIREQYAIDPLATEVPFFNSILADAGGAIWVRDYQMLLTDSTRFKIFARDGQWLTTLTLPPRHTLLEAGPDYLLTVWQDDDDLEHVRLYRLRRGLGGGDDEGM